MYDYKLFSCCGKQKFEKSSETGRFVNLGSSYLAKI